MKIKRQADPVGPEKVRRRYSYFLLSLGIAVFFALAVHVRLRATCTATQVFQLVARNPKIKGKFSGQVFLAQTSPIPDANGYFTAVPGATIQMTAHGWGACVNGVPTGSNAGYGPYCCPSGTCSYTGIWDVLDPCGQSVCNLQLTASYTVTNGITCNDFYPPYSGTCSTPCLKYCVVTLGGPPGSMNNYYESGICNPLGCGGTGVDVNFPVTLSMGCLKPNATLPDNNPIPTAVVYP
jgi:hypothetical protein